MAFAAGEVNSNIVGYVTKGLTASQKIQSGAQFVEVGTNELNISSIVLEGVTANGGVLIQWWNGATYEQAAWSSQTGLGDVPPVIPPYTGWAASGNASAKKTFAPGEGFWIIAPSSGVTVEAKVTQAGEVALSSESTYNSDVEISTKYMLINPLPTDIDISEIALEGVTANGGVLIQWWNGATYEQAAWSSQTGLGDVPPVIPPYTGWAASGNASAKKTFAPGEGFWIVAPSSGITAGAKVKIANQVLGVL